MAKATIKEKNALRDVRTARGLTQAQAAAKVGISRSQWSFLECRERPLTVAMLNLIKSQFELDPEEVDLICDWWGTHNLTVPQDEAA